MGEKRRWNLVADLAPLHRRAFGGKVLLAKRFASEASGGRDVKALIQAETQTNLNQSFDPEPLLALFRVRSLQHPKRMRSVDESFEGVKQSSELNATLSFWEMDFDGENHLDAKLGSVDCVLVKKGRAWRVKITGGESDPNEHVPYLRVVGDGDKNTYAMVPVDPANPAVGAIDKKGLGPEGKFYELAFEIEIQDPGYFVGPGEDSGRETHGENPTFPKWWRTYKQGEKQPSRRELPLLYSTYLENVSVDKDKLLGMVRDYYNELRDSINDYWGRYNLAVKIFDVRGDMKETEKPIAQPSVFGVLQTVYTLGSLVFPQLRSVGILITFVERWNLPDKHVSGDKIVGTWGQVGAAVSKLKEGKEVALKFVKDLDGLYAQTRDPKKRSVKTPLADFVAACYEQAGALQNHQVDGSKHMQELVKKGIEEGAFSQLKMRQIYDELKDSHARLVSHQHPKTLTLQRNLIVSFMNAHRMGLYTFSAEIKGVPWGPHSHVAGHDRFLEEHLYRALLRFNGGVFRNKDGELLVTQEQKRKFLPGLKLFREYTSDRHAFRHYSKDKTLEGPGDIDADTRHWLKLKDHDLRELKERPSADFKYEDESFTEEDFIHELKMWTETTTKSS